MDKPGKKRLDVLLVEKGFAQDLRKAEALILSGRVKVSDPARRKARAVSGLKPGTPVFENVQVEVEPPARFVSRGGEKLSAALDHWNLSVKGKICLDAGVSTGGFTDCLLQAGAKKIYAVDVGYGQIHPKLRNDPRVVLYEKTHILRWRPVWDNPPSFAVIDLSFISLTQVFERVRELTAANSQVLALVKPQFEVDPRFAKKGVVKDDTVRKQAVRSVMAFAEKAGFKALGNFPSPVLGAKGNQEYWIYLILP